MEVGDSATAYQQHPQFDEKRLSNDLTDAEPIEPVNAFKYGVIISVPLIYINANEATSVDKITSNLRAIKYDALVDLMKIAKNIPTSDKYGQITICDQLASRLSKQQNGEYNQFIDFLKWGGQMAKNLDVDATYVDIASIGVSFDVIRNYVVDDQTGVLKAAEPTIMNGYQLYSQIPNDELIRSIRSATNDTDFNRMQYYLAHFEKQLTFKPGYVLNQTPKFINMAFFFMCLYSESIPILGYSSNDLKGNILSHIVDVVIRSRVMQAWQRDTHTKVLLNDLYKNYDNRNHIIKLAQLTCARDRAQFFLNLVKNKGELANILDQNFYNRYESLLESFKLEIDGNTYYLLGASFICELGKILPSNILNVQKMCQEIELE
ncbi:GrBNV_gp36-like protein [Oryctes rhinoceros nudivirus]|uniref:GrBNV_gp36-like protein n=1 Tax=Oryctes rhinoceros nudivirus TaxID=92521 RepID=A0A6B9QQL3_9VIRU|nr:GrBNV_gp36-like protein [Oryctes rhinoceros nudivirus]ACH96249.1 GrBNV_gp36-like protein [Oryctes rhinoceros nudivirus]QHG11351.1 GrBNV_gp36-like protein [Oryctes rhinoceros nudivirus]QKE59581.1 GrBNV_gp36-like protein [Oryctes rhinoceros nudivirus]UBO76528.1 GrBNV_gp36-like protein [Oryctes rhinoceros nudivirus]UBR58296.1 gp36-like protein [Oryctes rhinoceros nudivirus]